MAVNLSGSYLEATIEGTAAEVTVETVHGNAKVVGGCGAMSLRSVMASSRWTRPAAASRRPR